MERFLITIASSVALSLSVSVNALAQTATNAPSTNQTSGPIAVAGDLVVSLDARDASAGTTNWVNKGSMGNFERIGAPKVAEAGGQRAVQFNGTGDAYRSVKTTPSSITGASARSIEVWVFNPKLDSTEECMVAWGHRGTSRANMAFSYGSGGGFSAVTHYDDDMSWGEDSPTAGKWHHLVYTYDGKTAKIYDNGTERGSHDYTLVTAANDFMNIAVENGGDGIPLFQSEFDDNWPLSLSGSIAIVRVHSGALTPEQIKSNFAADKARFGQ